MRLNLGCGKFPLKGYRNVDAHCEEADIRCDVFELDEHHPGIVGVCSEIRMDHMLEHVSWRHVPHLLRKCHRWLAPGGVLVVEVPDMGEIMRGNAGGTSWVQAVYGSQDHPGEAHLAGFTASSLSSALAAAGFVVDELVEFASDHPSRPGFPCILARASKGRAA